NSGPNDPLLQNGATIQSLQINSGAKLNLGTSGQLTVTGTLTNNAGTSGLHILSNASGTGSLIHNTDNVPFTIERYVTGGENAGGGTSIYKYHLISIPLASDIQAGDVFTGTYLWHFVPNQADEASWLGITSLTENLDNQKGFLSYVADESDKFIFTGTMNNGDFTVATESIEADNVKLIPNPYPSAIDWETVDLTGTGLNPTIWLFNSNTGNYESYNDGAGLGQQYIPVGQAVFVEAASADPSLTFTNAHRTHNQGNGFYKSGDELAKDLLKIAVSANNSSDATFIRFREQANNAYNGFDDATKLKGFSGAPQLFTHATDGKALSINTLATSQETVIVPVSFELDASGEAVLSFEYLETFEPEVEIYLEDLLTDQMINIRETGHYTFSHEVENDPLRFNLHFMGVTAVQDLRASENHFKVWTNENQLYILPTDKLTEGSLQIELFDVSGRLIQSVDKQVQKPVILSLPDYDGIMLVRIQNEKLVQTQKIFIR
ncbi:MAG TPA: T9SS type A sorting domain-containing protein, partial [Bacteroidales bacterium]|nr:T9SS type A sorting domain-containing protein [Bacteroidales bacterium]